MLVYRIEHEKTRRGPYNPGKLPDDHTAPYDRLGVYSRYSGDSTVHPAPDRDGITDNAWTFPEHLYFGFASPEQLADWFSEGFVEEAAEAGFVVSVYYAHLTDVLVGGHQVAFPRDDARLIRQCRTFDELADPYATEGARHARV